MSIFQRIFQRYIQDKVTPSEKEMIHGWYESYGHQPLEGMTAQEETDIKQSIRFRLNSNLQATGDLPVAPVARMRTTWLKYTAAAAITGITAFGVYRLATQKHTPKYTAIAANAGQQKKINLPDGTLIMLGANSQVSVPDDYNKVNREILMPQGEVFYDVAKDSTKPFIIHTGPLTVSVLGTSFHIRLLKGLREQEVLVKSGRVQVSEGEKVLGILTRGSRLLYDTASRQYTIQDHKEKMIDQVQQGWLVFENTPFTTFSAIIQNHYNIHIEDAGNKLSKAHFTAAFPPKASLKDIMEVLSSIHNITYKTEQDKLIIQ